MQFKSQIVQRYSDLFSLLINLGLKIYRKRVSKRIQGTIWVFRRKDREIHNFSVLLEKEMTPYDKKSEEIIDGKTSHKLKLRLTPRSLSNIANNLAEILIKINAKIV